MSETFPFYNRLVKNWQKNSQLAHKHQIEAFRIYDRDLPEYPYLIDIYKDHILLADRREPIDFGTHRLGHYENVLDSIPKVTGLNRIHIKRRQPQRVGDKSQQYQKQKSESVPFVVRESQAKFWVDLESYLDTGLFLDHRLLRQKVYKWVQKEAQVLNLFSYTCSVSVFAALKGAQVTSVDLSRTYLEWGKKNFALNGISLDTHQFIEKDAREFLARSTGHYDLIFLDPPTFSNSKSTKEDFEVEQDHVEFIQRCMDRLKPIGLLLFSNNKRSFQMSPEIKQEFKVKEVSKETLPFDFRDQKIRHVFEIRK